MKAFVKKLFFIFTPLIVLFSCSGDLPNFNSDIYEYENSFSKGPISLEMKVDKTEISTNRFIKVFLEGTASEGWKPSFPDLQENLDKFTLANYFDTPGRIGDDGSTVIVRTIILKPFLSGEYEIPSLVLDYIDQDKNKGALFTTPVSISVTSLLPENTENLQLKGIHEPDTFNYWRLFLIISIVIIILGGISFLVLLIRRHKRGRITPAIPPYEEAFNKLTLLLKKNLPQEGRIKEFYFQLNQIVRVYIEKQFAIRAPEQTTEEFLQDLAVSNKIADEFKQVLKEFLIHSDLVKFARHKPESDEISDSVESCKNFIKVTGEIL